MQGEINLVRALLQGRPIDTVRIADLAVTNAKIADLAVDDAKIANLRWNKGQGGTLTLGGTDNVNGILSLLDALAVEKVRLDKDGLLINDGKVIIKDNEDTAIIDAKGLISTANFGSDYKFDAPAFTTSSSSFVDVTGASLTQFNLTRNTKFFMYLFVSGMNEDWVVDGSFTEIEIYDSDTSLHIMNNYLRALYSPAPLMADEIQNRGALVGLEAGNHTLKLRCKSVGGGQSDIDYYSIGYVKLGT